MFRPWPATRWQLVAIQNTAVSSETAADLGA